MDPPSLLHAVRAGSLQQLCQLLAAGADVNEVVLEAGWDDTKWDFTALHIAAESKDVPVAGQLLAAGANVNAADGWRCTPLHSAARQGDVSMAGLLLAAGADVNKVSGWEDATPLHIAAGRGDLAMVNKLLAAGADVHAWSSYLGTPLSFAVREAADTSVLRALLAAGADARWVLDTAAEKGLVEHAALLLAAGACMDRHPMTPTLRRAATVETVQLLVAAGADLAKRGGSLQDTEFADVHGHICTMPFTTTTCQ